EYVPTVFQNTSVIIDFNSTHYEVALWDTAGQEDYCRLRPLSYPGSDAFLLCFSIDQPETFYNVTDKWIKEILHYCDKVPIVLVGLKADLRDDSSLQQYCISSEQGYDLVKRGMVQCYVECSSLTGYQIEKPIESALILSDKLTDKTKKKKNCKMM
ncbi:GTP-binding protein Rho1, partial [Kappamyces sp. JEL0680]